jgi:anionic cell wall polymer biosynthesis LytR-Cps2A-Psr (LCP) family protein
MKQDLSVLFLTVIGLMVFGISLYMGSQDIRDQRNNYEAKEALQKMSYFKDQKGNCYAYQPNTPKFSWIPCELTK